MHSCIVSNILEIFIILRLFYILKFHEREGLYREGNSRSFWGMFGVWRTTHAVLLLCHPAGARTTGGLHAGLVEPLDGATSGSENHACKFSVKTSMFLIDT